MDWKNEPQASAVRDLPQVEFAMQELEKAIEVLRDAVGIIDAKTQKAQRPQPTVSTKEGSQKSPEVEEAPLAKSIRSDARSIVAIQERLASIANLIEL